MKLTDALLLEGLSPVLYHGTNLQSFIKIIKTNAFRLAPAFTKDIEGQHSDKMYFISMARNRSAPYHRDPSSLVPHVLIEVNGRKLSHNVSGVPIDYWGTDFRRIKPTGFEQEDRVVSDKPYIDNAMSFMTRVDIRHNPDANPEHNKAVFDVYMILRRKGIPTYIYPNKNDWILGNKNYLDNIDIKLMLKGAEEPDNIGLSPEYKYKSLQRAKQTPIGSYLAAMKTDNLRAIPDQKVIKNFLMYYNPEQGGSTLAAFKSEFHNAYKSDVQRNLIEEIGREMKKHNLKTLKELADFIYYKWREIVYPRGGR